MDWGENRSLENRYLNSINRLVRGFLESLEEAKTLSDMQQILQNMTFSKQFTDVANLIASRFITSAAIKNARDWRNAAKQASNGRAIYEGLKSVMNETSVGEVTKQKILENANLIKTLPLEVSKEVNKFIATEAFRGIRSSDMQAALQAKIRGYSQAKASLIARTETSKAMVALTEARSKSVGVNWYIWRTANDGLRVRPSHRLMKDVICNYDEPPAPEELLGEPSAGNYNAGNIYNCRCFARPLIDINSVSWPHKIYYDGKIQAMTRAQFEKIM